MLVLFIIMCYYILRILYSFYAREVVKWIIKITFPDSRMSQIM